MHNLDSSVFAEVRFWLLMLISVVLPFALYAVLMLKKAISRATVLLFGFSLVAIAGLDVYVLQLLATAARHSPSLVDDGIFVSEVSIALYILPALFGGLGINTISHVLTSHLIAAEQKFAQQRRATATQGRPDDKD